MMRKLIIGAIIIAVAWLWVSVIFQSCNKNKTKQEKPTITNDLEDDNTAESISDYTDIEDEYDDRSGERSDEMDLDLDETEEEPIDDEEGMEETLDTEEDKEVADVSTRSTNIQFSGDKGGKYIVVAGAFRSRDNAKGMLAKLKNLGYEDAEIVKFDYDEHHAICIGRYDSLSAAKSVSKDLKSDHGIENYVHQRRFKKKR